MPAGTVVLTAKISKSNRLSMKFYSEEALHLAMELVGTMIEGYAIDEISKPKPHRTEPKMRPNVDTGRLRNSITHRAYGNTVEIGTNVEYAPYIECGTHRMQAYPFLKPAVENNIDKVNDIIENVLLNATV